MMACSRPHHTMHALQVAGDALAKNFKRYHHPLPAAVAWTCLPGAQYGVMASPTNDKPSGKPRRKRRWLQFGLPTLLGLVTVLCVVLGLWVQRAERQRRAVATIEAIGGFVTYEAPAEGKGSVA
jgi:hypothetical protein